MGGTSLRAARALSLVAATLLLAGTGLGSCGTPSGQGTGGAGGGATSATGGAAGGGATGATGGGATGGSATGGAAGTTSSGTGGAAGQAGTQACANPTDVLPLNPTNAQDGITIGNFYVDTDTWNAASYTVSQTMYICDYDNWYVVAKMDNSSGDGAVKTYPDVHEDFDSAPALSSFTSISSSFAHAGPHVGIYEFAYDMWLNGVADKSSIEVMVWTDNFNQVPSGSVQETFTLGGQSFQVWKSGNYIALVATANVTSGTLDLLAIFNHLIAKGWVPANATLGAIDYGVELVSTDGMDATFAVTGFSLTTS
ncbi:MAG TPA: hypothetical protein VKZ18_12390 [Polyangia bacterium]|nr:hypothetical protein [Polyangia bacterium]